MEMVNNDIHLNNDEYQYCSYFPSEDFSCVVELYVIRCFVL